MKFHEQLNVYMQQVGATVSSLAGASGLSDSVVSRYKNGKRLPAEGSDQLAALADGLEKLAKERDIALSDVLETLSASLSADFCDMEVFSVKLDELLTVLQIRSVNLAKALRYDPSYISKIRAGKRRPSDIDEFVTKLCSYLVRFCQDKEEKRALSYLLACDPKEVEAPDELSIVLSRYLCVGIITRHTETVDFLKALDCFDLNDYIESIHFNEIKVPAAPFHLPKSQNYYGTEGLKEAELAFEKATVLSRAKTPVFMYSDMPMDTLVDDEFPKKWMMGLALILKKGLHIQVVHYLDRPFRELMLGLEAWIPLYMTGQVSPFYLEKTNTSVFRHMLYTSGAAALSGECIVGKDETGRKYVTNNKRELEYFQNRAKEILEKAHPLMEVYREEHRRMFEKFLEKLHADPSARHNRWSGPSLAAMPVPLLEEIIEEAGFSEAERSDILRLAEAERQSCARILSQNEVIDYIPVLDEAAYAKTPLALPLGTLFLKKQAMCSYRQYQSYLEAVRKFAEENKNYHLVETDIIDFKNIQIQVVDNSYVLISKTNLPTIHFVIHHPRLVDAIENMVIPIRE